LTGPLLESVIPADWLLKGHFVCSTQGDEMDVKLQITTLDMQKVHSVTALLDTGCTGSSIDSNFIRWHGINTQKLYAPIPVYNADGLHNSSGPSTEYVELHVKVQDHLERLMFAVTDLGKSKIFLGYNWLKAHNPSIDWNTESIVFYRCPLTCEHRINSLHIKEDIELPPTDTASDNKSDNPEDRLEDGDRTFLFDYGDYLGFNRQFENLTAHGHSQKVSIKNGKAHVSTPIKPCEYIICELS
jgi:hypothetical protein